MSIKINDKKRNDNLMIAKVAQLIVTMYNEMKVCEAFVVLSSNVLLFIYRP